VTGTVLFGHTSGGVLTASQAASALGPLAGPYAQALFAIGLIGAGLLAVPILSASAAYALREFFGLPGTLKETRLRGAPRFYGIIALSTVIGVALNFVGFGAIEALYLSAIVNGLVAPPLLVLIVRLGSDRRIMGSLASGGLSRWLTWIATGAMGAAAAVLIGLSIP
jgi:Mn2+/Fe2+ NRAMP family transporter